MHCEPSAEPRWPDEATAARYTCGVRNSLTANILQVLSLRAPASAPELLERVCKERGWRAADLTSSQLEQLIPALCAALAAQGDDGDVREDLRLLLDTDRFRRERLESKDKKPSVLVVEDDEDTRATFGQVLEEAGYEVTQAARGDEAWSLLGDESARPAAIVLDLMMPVMSGWQLLERMQGTAFETIPVIVVTASGQGPGSFGKTIVLRKPVSRTQLLGAVSVSVLR